MASKPEMSPGPWRVRRGLVGLGFVVVGLIATTALGYRYWASSAVPPKITSIAVLPLQNLSGDATQEYLADGMTEAVIARLTAIRNLRVSSHTSVMRFKAPQVSLPEIGRALGVDAIVEGSISRVGDRVRVVVQLIRATNDDHLWSETYDRDLRDVLALQSELAQSIAAKVEVTVSGRERQLLAATRVVSPEVYESYLQGRFAYRKDVSKEVLEQSARYYEDAIRLDSTFAPAYVGLAQTLSRLGTVFVGGLPNDTRPRVMDAARKALALDPDLADAHVLLARAEQARFHWTAAETEFRRALELSPNDPGAHAGFASWLMCHGRLDEALQWVERGRRLDPLAVSGAEVAWILFQAHRYEEAERELRGLLAVEPDHVDGLIMLGFVLSAERRDSDAVVVLERAITVSAGSPAATGMLIRTYARAGRRDRAMQLLAELQQRNSVEYVPTAAFVNAYLGLGATDDALAWLERAYAEKSNILQSIGTHPFFDPIRGDPRFADLAQRVWREPND